MQDHGESGRIVALALALMGLMPWQTVIAQSPGAVYANRPLKLIVPLMPGGLVDSFGRALAQHLSDRLGQPVVVENRPGASQAIALETVAKSSPDGYTLLLGPQSGMVLNTVSRKSLPYDVLRDFAPISMLFVTPVFLVVHPSTPATSVRELISLARSNPGKYAFASLGRGTSAHLAGETFKTMAQIDLLHVPYKGSAQASTALLGGDVQMMFEGGVSSLPHVRSGKMRALASTGPTRSEDAIPNLPTMSETLPGFDRVSWFALFAPAGVPRPIIERLNHEAGEYLRMPSTKEKFLAVGVELAPSTPEELGARLRSELPIYAKTLREAGINPE
ncbi:MAG: tripartite tricarboxylate transporter substrate binding protein [Betaproteobacteria bacterium]|nr:tripartite tricarboxylate transporter substrate binding protein [Betaproteobacteria bacterium]